MLFRVVEDCLDKLSIFHMFLIKLSIEENP